MVEYESLVGKVTKIAKEISEYSIGKVEMLLEKAPELEGEDFEKFKRLLMDIGHDREYCELIGVEDYNSLPRDDFARVSLFALELYKEDKDMILPYFY